MGNCIDNLNMLSQNNQVQLMWVSRHSDIEGNEQADTLAKTRAHTLCEIHEPQGCQRILKEKPEKDLNGNMQSEFSIKPAIKSRNTE